MAIKMKINRIKNKLRDQLKHRWLSILQATEGALILWFYNELLNLTASINDNIKNEIILWLAIAILLTFPYFAHLYIKNRELKNDILEYNKNHFIEKDFGKHFDDFAGK